MSLGDLDSLPYEYSRLHKSSQRFPKHHRSQNHGGTQLPILPIIGINQRSHPVNASRPFAFGSYHNGWQVPMGSPKHTCPFLRPNLAEHELKLNDSDLPNKYS